MSDPARAPRGPRRGPGWRGRVAAISLGVALAVATAELTARVALGQDFEAGELRARTWRVLGRFDPGLGWANAPGARAHVVDGEIDYRVAINSRGLRDPERSVTKPEGVRRVALIGDSVAWGWGADDGERFSDLLDARLGPEVEVLNFGVPGYGTDQQLWTLEERVDAYDPDLVLWCFILNDLEEVERTESYGMGKPRLVQDGAGHWTVENRPVPDPRTRWERWTEPLRRGLAAHAALSAWAEARGRDPQEETLEKTPSPEQFERRRQIEEPLVREAADRLVDPESRIHALMEGLVAACADQGAPLLAFNVAHKHDQFLYEPALPAPEPRTGVPFRTYLSRRFGQACAELGVRCVSLDQAMLAAVRRGERLHCGDGHLNRAGNRVVADVLEPLLRIGLGLRGELDAGQ